MARPIREHLFSEMILYQYRKLAEGNVFCDCGNADGVVALISFIFCYRLRSFVWKVCPFPLLPLACQFCSRQRQSWRSCPRVSASAPPPTHPDLTSTWLLNTKSGEGGGLIQLNWWHRKGERLAPLTLQQTKKQPIISPSHAVVSPSPLALAIPSPSPPLLCLCYPLPLVRTSSPDRHASCVTTFPLSKLNS